MRTLKMNLITRWLAGMCLLAVSLAPPLTAQETEIPAGTRFLVELRDRLDAQDIAHGKKFEARTVETLTATDGTIIPADTKLEGRVSYVRDNEMILRFERIKTHWGKLPLAASVVSVPGEHDVKRQVSDEGEIKASGGRGKGTAIGMLIGGGAGAAIGATAAGGKGAAIGAGAGAATGGLIGAASSGKNLTLERGARLELQLDRPLVLTPER